MCFMWCKAELIISCLIQVVYLSNYKITKPWSLLILYSSCLFYFSADHVFSGKPESSYLQFKMFDWEIEGKQHKYYGVPKEHYPIVHDTLLKTIEVELADACTYKIMHAWKSALDFVGQPMRNYDY